MSSLINYAWTQEQRAAATTKCSTDVRAHKTDDGGIILSASSDDTARYSIGHLKDAG